MLRTMISYVKINPDYYLQLMIPSSIEQKIARGKQAIKYILLAILTLLLTLKSIPTLAQTNGNVAQAQSDQTNNTERAEIVVDGKVLFEIGDFNNYTSADRAKQINQILEEEVHSPKPVKLSVFQENQQIVIRNRTTERHILTVTQGDVIGESTTFSQALIWSNTLQNALRQGQLERSPSYYRRAILVTMILLFGGTIIQVFLIFFGKLPTRKLYILLNNPNSNLYTWQQQIKTLWQTTLLTLQVFMWLSIWFYISSTLPELRSLRYKVFNLLNSRIIVLGESEYSAIQLLLLLVFTIALWFLVKLITYIFKTYFLNQIGTNQGVQEVIAVLVQYLLTFLGLIVLWQIWGLDVASFAILASVLGVGIGFGIQNITNNFISGIILTLERPIQIGDLIKINDLVGTVQNIGARSTVIRTLDRVSIIVPNSHLLESEIINWNHSDPVSRLRIRVGVAYGSDIRKVRAALLRAAKNHPDVLMTPRPKVWFQEFGDSSLEFELLVWISNPEKQFQLKSELNYRIEASLRSYGVHIPFPQRDVNLRSPQLDRFLQAWLMKEGISPVDSVENGNLLDDTVQEEKDNLHLQDYSDTFFVSFEDRLTTFEINQLVQDMKGPNGLDIKDRRYHFHLYECCFVGSDAVDWIVNKRNCTREEAIEIGQILLEQGIIHHVVDKHNFKDTYLFYCFYSDENRFISKK